MKVRLSILARFCVAELVHAVGRRECRHIFEPKVSDCAARRGTSDLVDLSALPVSTFGVTPEEMISLLDSGISMQDIAF
jgi:hypothetical protein